ncbi:hypothetical protein SAMN05444920_118226 [Nonomuraea solani]|uniref:Uncharacterized protein n=1 Tax=Nonomuraea solani TaxID=1144553 RepID=A0A1H6ET43_9ACTN|nr:hypothetical protein [Nonomuraea solani]SEH01037.1 hypothetical protein SAMN05444920_118226 [Nonomuraea solani]
MYGGLAEQRALHGGHDHAHGRPLRPEPDNIAVSGFSGAGPDPQGLVAPMTKKDNGLVNPPGLPRRES